MAIATAEIQHKPGFYYARSDDGLDLPVVDLTNPAFAVEITQEELDRRLQAHMRELAQREKVPQFIQKFMLRFMMRRSGLMRAIMGAEGGFLGGMSTYLLKLGPENMDHRYTGSIDRQIAASLPGLSMRLRLQDVVRFLADGLIPALSARQGAPLHLLNIGGGPAIDSLNALLVLHKEHPELIAGRPISIHILDLVEAGPHFGQRALESLQAESAPLHGLNVRLEQIPYDWSNAAPLLDLLRSFEGNAVIAASSEGALFEYGSDEDITANLRALWKETSADAIVVGSVTRSDAIGRLLNAASRAALQLRGIDKFSALAEAAGWRVDARIDRIMSHDICLRKV